MPPNMKPAACSRRKVEKSMPVAMPSLAEPRILAARAPARLSEYRPMKVVSRPSDATVFIAKSTSVAMPPALAYALFWRRVP